MKNKKGYTLVELFIMLAIIGIILAIAIPNLVNAIERDNFKTYFGIEVLPDGSLQNPVVKEMLKPVITKKLAIYKEACENAKLSEKTLSVPQPTADPRDVAGRIIVYQKAHSYAEVACQLFTEADAFAAKYGIK